MQAHAKPQNTSAGSVGTTRNHLETQALFYADIAFDVKQLVLFYKQGLRDYLLINAIGMMAPPISTCCAAFAWLQQESREVQHFRRLVPSHAMQVLVLLVLISTQTHMIFLVLLLALDRVTVELKLGGCAKIPGTAWAKVRGAQWPNLQKADFSECFDEEGEGAEDLLQVLAQCEALEELKLGGCQQIPGTAWAKVRGAQWPNLQKADFCASWGDAMRWRPWTLKTATRSATRSQRRPGSSSRTAAGRSSSGAVASRKSIFSGCAAKAPGLVLLRVVILSIVRVGAHCVCPALGGSTGADAGDIDDAVVAAAGEDLTAGHENLNAEPVGVVLA
eukprot:Skav233758  [mRNA]  locus=scaffold1792:402073:410486:- [translate_table: standard]